jgi:hypothetical protein
MSLQPCWVVGHAVSDDPAPITTARGAEAACSSDLRVRVALRLVAGSSHLVDN